MDKKLINITEQNYDLYNKLYRTKNGDFDATIEEVLRIQAIRLMSCLGFITVPTFSFFNVVLNNYINESTLLGYFDLCAGISFVGTSFSVLGIPKIVASKKIKKMQQEHPEIDTNIDYKTLERELTKYEELSTALEIANEINEEKEEHLQELNDRAKEMTTAEKIEYLEKEKQFWEEYADYEKSSINEKKNQMIRK